MGAELKVVDQGVDTITGLIAQPGVTSAATAGYVLNRPSDVATADYPGDVVPTGIRDSGYHDQYIMTAPPPDLQASVMDGYIGNTSDN